MGIGDKYKTFDKQKQFTMDCWNKKKHILNPLQKSMADKTLKKALQCYITHSITTKTNFQNLLLFIAISKKHLL